MRIATVLYCWVWILMDVRSRVHCSCVFGSDGIESTYGASPLHHGQFIIWRIDDDLPRLRIVSRAKNGPMLKSIINTSPTQTIRRYSRRTLYILWRLIMISYTINSLPPFWVVSTNQREPCFFSAPLQCPNMNNRHKTYQSSRTARNLWIDLTV